MAGAESSDTAWLSLFWVAYDPYSGYISLGAYESVWNCHYYPFSPFMIFKKLFSVCTVTQWKIKMQTLQYRTSRIWEMKEDKYTKRLAKNQVCAIFQMRDIRKNDLPKFIKLCMETPCWSGLWHYKMQTADCKLFSPVVICLQGT